MRHVHRTFSMGTPGRVACVSHTTGDGTVDIPPKCAEKGLSRSRLLLPSGSPGPQGLVLRSTPRAHNPRILNPFPLYPSRVKLPARIRNTKTQATRLALHPFWIPRSSILPPHLPIAAQAPATTHGGHKGRLRPLPRSHLTIVGVAVRTGMRMRQPTRRWARLIGNGCLKPSNDMNDTQNPILSIVPSAHSPPSPSPPRALLPPSKVDVRNHSIHKAIRRPSLTV